MLLISVEVSVKVACLSTTATDTYLSGRICKKGLLVHDSHRLLPQSHHHATYLGESIYESGL